MRFVSGPRMPPSTFGKLIVAGVAAPGLPTGKVTSVLGFELVRPTAVSAALAAPAVSALSTPATAIHAAARVARLRVIVASFRHARGEEERAPLPLWTARGPPLRFNSECARIVGLRRICAAVDRLSPLQRGGECPRTS